MAGDNTFSGNVTLNSDSRIGADAGQLDVAGAVTGANRALSIVGAGTVVLQNTGNTFGSGLADVNAAGLSILGGNLVSGAAGVVPDNTVVQVQAGTWDLDGHDENIRASGFVGLRLGGLAGTATVDTGGAR